MGEQALSPWKSILQTEVDHQHCPVGLWPVKYEKNEKMDEEKKKNPKTMMET